MAALLFLATCGAIGVFWHFDSRERPEVVLTPDAIPAALKPGMLIYDVNVLTNRPRSGEIAPEPLEPVCSLLSDGSTLVCVYDKNPKYPWSHGDGMGILKSFERLRFEGLEPLFGHDLFPAVRVIHLAPPGVANAFDPISLIRGVNGLQRLGKSKALAALRAYVALSRNDPTRSFRYDIDERRAFLIARVLFDFPKTETDPPVTRSDFPYAITFADPDNWPEFPLFIQNDIPFCVDQAYETPLYHGSGDIDSIEAFLIRCEKSGLMRSAPLTPTCTPLDALEALAKSERWAGRKFDYENESASALAGIRIQAIRAISPLFITLKNEDWTCLELASRESSDRIWSHFLHDARLKRMKWEPHAQRFVIGG